jgi:hypothetical protein
MMLPRIKTVITLRAETCVFYAWRGESLLILDSYELKK